VSQSFFSRRILKIFKKKIAFSLAIGPRRLVSFGEAARSQNPPVFPRPPPAHPSAPSPDGRARPCPFAAVEERQRGHPGSTRWWRRLLSALRASMVAVEESATGTTSNHGSDGGAHSRPSEPAGSAAAEECLGGPLSQHAGNLRKLISLQSEYLTDVSM
jgi:hypothetical protein